MRLNGRGLLLGVLLIVSTEASAFTQLYYPKNSSNNFTHLVYDSRVCLCSEQIPQLLLCPGLSTTRARYYAKC